MTDLFVLGDANIDVLMPIDAYPAPGGDKRSERTVIGAGGSAANTALALARLGFRPSLLACIGQDLPGQMLRAELADGGVDLGHLQTTGAAGTGMMFVPVTPDGQRTLFGRRGANRQLQGDGLPLEWIGRAGLLHLSGYAFLEGPQVEAAQSALSAASDRGVFRSLDTAYEPAFAAGDRLRALLPSLDLLVVGEAEAADLTGASQRQAILDWLLEAGVGCVALKLGGEGSLIADAGGRLAVPAFEVAVIDTTGAGDNFSAGLLAGQLLELDLPAAAVLATAVAGLATTVWGAGNAPPGLPAIRRLLNDQGPALPDPGLVHAAQDVLDKLRGPAGRPTAGP